MPADPLMRTISGIRGIAGTSLTDDVVRNHVSAFVLQLRERYHIPITIILGRDSRISGPHFSQIAIEAVRSMGADVIDIGIVPTPTVQEDVLLLHAVGGIIITSSHNPKPWNGLKFVDSDGLFLAPEHCTSLFQMVDEHVKAPKWAPAEAAAWGKLTRRDDGAQMHIDALLRIPYIRPEEIAKANLHICFDPVNGGGGPTLMRLFERLGVHVHAINLEPTGDFAHTPEPIPENLADLSRAVVAQHADMGIAVDPDADRCVFLDEEGKPLVEEYTLALAVEFMLGVVGARGIVCKNMSSSRVTDDIGRKYGCEVRATAVGEINVAKEMERCRAVIGGEGNGGVMLPALHIGRDSLVATCLALQLFAIRRKENPHLTLHQLKMTLPQYEIVKDKLNLGTTPPERIDAWLARLEVEWRAKGARITTGDGLRIDHDGEGWWVHLRRSNTEPIARIIGEASTRELAAQRCAYFRDLMAAVLTA